MNTQDRALPSEWHVKRLKEYCDVVTSSLSYTDFKELKEESSNDAVNVLGIKVSDMNLTGNETQIVISNLTKRISPITASKKTVPPGTVVFPKRGAAIATNKKRLTTTWTVFDPNLIGVRPRKELISEYVYYWFLHFDLRKITDPGPTPQLNKKDLEPLLIPIPPIEEQHHIAHVLATVQTAIEQQARLIALTRELKSALMRKLFTEGLHGEKQKETEIGLVPESWEVQLIAALDLDIGDGNYASKYPRREEFISEGVPFIRANNLMDGRISWKDMRFISRELHEELRKGHIKKDDVCVVTRGDIGQVAFVTDEFIGANMNAQLVRLNGIDTFDGRFLYFVLASEEMQKQFKSLTTGTALQQLPIGKLKFLQLPIPKRDEQEDIANMLWIVEQRTELADQKKFRLEQLFRTLLHQLMTGQTRVNGLEFDFLDIWGTVRDRSQPFPTGGD